MTTPDLFEADLPRLRFAAVPSVLLDLPGYKPAYASVALALIDLARCDYECSTFRADLARRARVGVKLAIEFLGWLQERGYLSSMPDRTHASGRRFHFLWRRPDARDGDPESAEPPPIAEVGGAPPEGSGAHPLEGRGRTARGVGGARLEVRPPPKERAREDELDSRDSGETVSSPSPESPPPVAVAAPAEGTGRDGTVALRSGDGDGSEGEPFVPDPKQVATLIAEYEATLAEPEPRRPTVPERLKRTGARLSLARLLARDYSELAPVPPPKPPADPCRVPLPRSERVEAEKPAPKIVHPSEEFPLAEAIALCRAIPRAPRSRTDPPPPEALRAAEFLGQRWCDTKPQTLEFLAGVLPKLGEDVIAGLIRDAERTGREPIKLFTKWVIADLALARANTERRF